MNTKIAIANWKMHKNLQQAVADFTHLGNLLAECHTPCWTAVAAPHMWLPTLSHLPASTPFLLAQSVHHAPQGAHTGETSVAMLQSAQILGSLVGHSERRQTTTTDCAAYGKQCQALLQADLIAVLCVGETLAQRQEGCYHNVIKNQIEQAFSFIDIEKVMEKTLPSQTTTLLPFSPLIIAYEPVWAIGTGQTASLEQVAEIHGFIHDHVLLPLGDLMAQKTALLYGGSVKSSNAKDLFHIPHVDGLLVGSASLEPEEMALICQKAMP